MNKYLDPQKFNWRAFYTKPRAEFKAREELNSKNIDNYLPTITVVRQWSDRKKKVTEPLFKSYIFAYVNEKERLTTLQQKSIVTCVNFSGKPAIIPDIVIEDLKLLMSKPEKVRVTERLEVGTRVKILEGPFAGVHGLVFKNNLDENMFAITIDLLNRSVVVHLEPNSVIKEMEY